MFRFNADMIHPMLGAGAILAPIWLVGFVIGNLFCFRAKKELGKTFWWSVINSCILAPTIEELAFRWPILLLVQHNCSENLLTATVVGSSMIFGLLHIAALKEANFGAMAVVAAVTACLSLVACLLVIQTGSLMPAILFHAIYNLILISLGVILRKIT